jgi:hypothetical protein
MHWTRSSKRIVRGHGDSNVTGGVIASVHITLSLPCGEQKSTIRRVNYWNIIADTLEGSE